MKKPEKPMSQIPQLAELKEQLQNVQSVEKILPLLSLLGVDTDGMDQQFASLRDLGEQANELALLPDAFNDLLSEKGWIMYDHMNVEVAKSTIKLARQGNIDDAEKHLVDYYTPDIVEWLLRMMWSVKAFHARMPLAEKALQDYKEERYHACVPVVLALLDGMVNEIHYKRGLPARGFFADGVDLTAWNSLAGHSKGLSVLVRIFQKSRTKTTTDTISVPYRNGILHGMDLNYDNKIVAAKAWAALFATRD